RVEAGAAQRLGHAQREEAELAHLAQHLARYEARFLPFRSVRLHLLVDEAAQLGADEVVFLGEDGMCHGGAMLHSRHVTRQRLRIARSARRSTATGGYAAREKASPRSSSLSRMMSIGCRRSTTTDATLRRCDRS